MEPTQKKKKRWLLWVLVPLALLALGALALVFVLGNSGVSGRYDDPEAILAQYERDGFASLIRQKDGTATLTLEKEDLYYLADQYDICRTLREALEADGDLMRYGFRLQDGKVNLYLLRRTIGRLPLTYRAVFVPRSEGAALVFSPEDVVMGTRIRLKESRWPEVLRKEYKLDLSGTEFGGDITAVYLRGSSAMVEFAGLRALDSARLTADQALLTAMSFLGTPREAAGMYDLLRGRVGGVIPAEELGAAVLSGSDPADTLSDWMAWCVPSSLSSLWEGRSALIRQQIWEPELQLSDMKQQMLVKYLADEQGKYERLLFALRETYRSGALKLSDGGLYNSAGEKVDPSTLSKLNVTPTDSRIVFLLSPSGSQEISCQDMPTLEEVPKVDWRTASLDDAALVPDLGVVLTTGGNIPILLHRRADGTLVFREITQDLYISVLVEQGIPRIDMDTLPAPMTEYARSAGEGWTGAVLLPLGN